jgi:hypothetical protein
MKRMASNTRRASARTRASAFFTITAITLGAVASAGCSATTEPANDEIGSLGDTGRSVATLRANAYPVDFVPVDVDEARVEFRRPQADALLARRPGDTIVGTRAPFLRKVVSVSANAERIIVNTEPADLVDVFETADVKVEIDGFEDESPSEADAPAPDADSVVPANGLGLQSNSNARYASRNRANFVLDLKERAFALAGTRIDMTVGEFRYTPRLQFEANIRGGRVQYLRLVFDGDFYSKFATRLETTGPKNITLYTVPIGKTPSYTFTVPIGPVTVPFVANMEFILAPNVSANDGSRIAVHQVTAITSKMAFGFECRESRCTPIGRNDSAITPSPATLTVSGTARANIGVAGKLNLKAGDVVGPFFSVIPYVGVETTRTTRGSVNDVRVGVRGEGGGELRVLDKFAVKFLQSKLFDVSAPVSTRAGQGSSVCGAQSTAVGSTRCNHSGLVAKYETIEACVKSGGGGACFTAPQSGPLCGASSGGGYTCNVDAMFACVCHDGGLECFHRHCRRN